MTLASIFLLCFLAARVNGPPASPGGQSPASPEQRATAAQNPPTQSSPDATPASAPKTTQKTSNAHARRKKKTPSPDCGTGAAPAQAGGTSHSGSPAPAGSSQSGIANQPQKPCPAPKIIVRQGGTAEPSIQLAGGPNDDQAAKQRNAVNELLGSTEQNLKKITVAQLNESQQDTVTQIQQFMRQSRSAVGDGDLERARTLAWKAEMLSEDLVKPPK